MRCGGCLGDFAGEIRVTELFAEEVPGEPGAAIVRWQGGGTKCGDVLGDFLGKLREVRWHVLVDGRPVSVTEDNRLEVELDIGAHSIIEVIGVAENVAHISSANVAARKPGGDRVRFTWEHQGTGDPTRFLIYWDAGEGGSPETLFATIPFEPGRTQYTYLTRPLADGYYNFGIAAADAAGNETTLLLSSVEILGLPDPPENFDYSYDSSDRSVILTWN